MTKTKAPTVDKLVKAFESAAVVARSVDNPSDDGGTCNFDQCVITHLARYRKRIEEAAAIAGVEVDYWNWAWMGNVFTVRVPGTGRGQAMNRTRVAEAICKVLKLHNISCTMFYQMD